MARSTGPIAAAAAITAFTGVIVHGRPVLDAARIAVGGAIAAGGLYLLEQVWPEGAVALSWLALVTILLVRVDPKVPAPAEAVANWINEA
jgi:hypothetical protein